MALVGKKELTCSGILVPLVRGREYVLFRLDNVSLGVSFPTSHMKTVRKNNRFTSSNYDFNVSHFKITEEWSERN